MKMDAPFTLGRWTVLNLRVKMATVIYRTECARNTGSLENGLSLFLQDTLIQPATYFVH